MRTLILGGLLAALLAGCTAGTPAQNPFVTGRTLNIAHQGGELLRPSNTLAAYRHAAGLGADMLEMDLHATRDGVMVLSHDATLDRLTDRRGAIASLSWDEVQQVDAGYAFTLDGGQTYPYRGQGIRVARLDEVLREFAPRPMTIELKQTQPSLVGPLCAALRGAEMQERVIVASFHTATLQEFRRDCPGVRTSMTESELRPLVLLSKVGLAGLVRAPGQVAQVPVRSGNIEIVTPAFVQAMHRQGVAVHVWTVNDPQEMRRLVRLGVDGIITDRPDLLGEVLREEGRGG